MVCQKCEKKLSKLAAPDPFTVSSSSNRKIGENKLLTATAGPGPSTLGKAKSGTSLGTTRFSPYTAGKAAAAKGGDGKCKDCKSNVSQNGAKYCHGCAYKKGACAICGKKIIDTRMYTMSAK